MVNRGDRSMRIRSKRVIFEDYMGPAILEIEDGLIKSVLDYNESYDIDYGSNYITPGLIDIHNHGYAGWAFTGTLQEDEVHKVLKRLLSEGVTSMVATAASDAYPFLNPWIENPTNDTTQLVGYHSEGPFINPEQYGAAPPDTKFIKPNVDLLEKRIRASNHHLKMMTLAPELQNSEPVIEVLRANDIKVSVGHSNITYPKLLEIENQVDSLTHLGNAMSSIHHRDIGAFGFGLHRDVYVELIADGQHVSKPMLELIFRCKSTDKILLVSDTIALGGLAVGRYDMVSGTVWMDESGTLVNEFGRMSGSSHTLLHDIKYLHENLEIPLILLFKMASTNPAEFLQLRDRGKIKPTMRGDLLILDEDLQIQEVYLQGIIRYNKEDIKETNQENVETLLQDPEYLNFYAIEREIVK